MDARLVRASKLLSRVLRHDPGRLGLTLDPEGWVDVDALLHAASAAGTALDRATLERVVAENDKRRFALSADGARIRALQGHSVPVDLGLEPRVPPETLFHGTAARFVDAILRDGIRAMSRTHVHLSADPDTARVVGRRHGSPAVLHVAARAMHAAGHVLIRSENGVWLAAAVPPEFLSLP